MNLQFSADARRVFEANDGREAVLNEQTDTNLKIVAVECEQRLDEIKSIVQTNLWTRYGQQVLLAAFEEAEKACEYANSIAVDSVNSEAYEVHLTMLEKLTKKAHKVLLEWETWIPATNVDDLCRQSKDLKVSHIPVEIKKAEFVRARRIAEEKRPAVPVIPGQGLMPVVWLKPAQLPVFSGCKRDFHHWKVDWQSLQRQGEPTGSPEMRKIQLLNSVDDKIVKELRLSTYSTAEDVCTGE